MKSRSTCSHEFIPEPGCPECDEWIVKHTKPSKSLARQIVDTLDGAAAVNLSEPSPGDLERVSKANSVLLAENKELKSQLSKLVEAVNKSQDCLVQIHEYEDTTGVQGAMHENLKALAELSKAQRETK